MWYNKKSLGHLPEMCFLHYQFDWHIGNFLFFVFFDLEIVLVWFCPEADLKTRIYVSSVGLVGEEHAGSRVKNCN